MYCIITEKADKHYHFNQFLRSLERLKQIIRIKMVEILEGSNFNLTVKLDMSMFRIGNYPGASGEGKGVDSCSKELIFLKEKEKF